jgi:coenzyme F420-reducing hydrogenase delta subunit/NAD-dependent dihydropyrimidine dehydrogenase PreA subunit
MPAGKEEVEEAEKEGIKLRYLSAPVSFSGNGKVTRARFVQMQLGEPDASGRRRPVPIENSEFDIEADSVILAIGYTPDSGLLEESGLELKRNGTLSVKDETGITNIAGVFAAGDVVSGPQSVIEAIASGRRVAEAIHCFFRNKSPKEKAGIIALEPLDESITNLISKAERQKMFSLPAEDRIRHFEEIDLGFSKEQALKEAQRCLNCGAGAHIGENCSSCLNCVRICPYDVPSPGKELVAVDINRCQACGICASECPASAITLGIDTMQDGRAEIDNIVDKARQESPEILILGFYCRYRSPLGPPLDRDEVYWIGKCCTGRIDTADLLYPFEFGVDGAVVQICEKDACRHREGNKYLRKHVKEAKKILDITGFNAGRLTVITDEEDISGFINTFDELGINPLRKGKKVKP